MKQAYFTLPSMYCSSYIFQVVSGSGSFSFDKKLILQLFKDSFQYVSDASILYEHGYRLEVNATFYEDLTGKVASGQGSVSFYEMDVKLKFADFNPKNFKPGLPFKALVSDSSQPKPSNSIANEKFFLFETFGCFHSNYLFRIRKLNMQTF